MKSGLHLGMSLRSGLIARPGLVSGLRLKGRFRFDCFDARGRLKWSAIAENIVTTEGLNDALDKHLAGSAYTAAWYMGLVNNAGFTAYAAGDTAAQIGGSNGWAEFTGYDEATREAITWSAASSGSKAASAAASFTINTGATIRGAFLASSSTKGGTSGVLFDEADLDSSRTVVSGDTLNVTPTITAADDGV